MDEMEVCKQKKMMATWRQKRPTHFCFFFMCVHGGCSTYFHRVIICKTVDREGHSVNNKEKIGERNKTTDVCISHSWKEILVDKEIVERRRTIQHNQRVQRSHIPTLNKHRQREKERKTRPNVHVFVHNRVEDFFIK